MFVVARHEDFGACFALLVLIINGCKIAFVKTYKPALRARIGAELGTQKIIFVLTTPSLSRIIGYSRAFSFFPLSARQNRAVLSSFVSVVFSFLFSKFDALAGCLLRVLGVITRNMSAFDAGMFAGLTMAAKSQSVFVRHCPAC